MKVPKNVIYHQHPSKKIHTNPYKTNKIETKETLINNTHSQLKENKLKHKQISIKTHD